MQRLARAEKERLESAARAEEAKKAREAEIAAANAKQQAGTDCDRLATNPTDSRRAADGVPFDQLKAVADQALEACTRATQLYPNELRYMYQLGRATQFKDRKRAFEIFASLVSRGYPAAFDNLGGMYVYDRKDIATATKLFAQGAGLGDADSMVSLADLVDKGSYGQQNLYQTKWALLTKAAELNHAGAQRALAAENIKLANTQAEQENARKAAEIFGSILGGDPTLTRRRMHPTHIQSRTERPRRLPHEKSPAAFATGDHPSPNITWRGGRFRRKSLPQCRHQFAATNPQGKTGGGTRTQPAVFSRATACQPMSRRQKPSGHLIRSTAL